MLVSDRLLDVLFHNKTIEVRFARDARCNTIRCYNQSEHDSESSHRNLVLSVRPTYKTKPKRRMKLLPEGIKPDWTMEKEKEMASKKLDDEESLVPTELPEEKPKTSTSKIVDVVKSTAHVLLEKKKETCCLLPQNCCLLSDKCPVSKLPVVRQIKEKLVHHKEETAETA
ncbi:unnamed protein product [Cylicocyclus nassatus]|uniref:Uncharacterized protein n=1 Tax=Cylicocyclus nassatus TaxID=53992 RepID=A0AA36MFU3_CYLNA|nr:unnamed protein product [Cylicocyclus nassatus]